MIRAGSTEMVTLEAGACGRLMSLGKLSSMGLEIPQSFCFKNWIKDGTISEPTEHYYNNTSLVTFCNQHEVLCRSSPHPLVITESSILYKKGV